MFIQKIVGFFLVALIVQPILIQAADNSFQFNPAQPVWYSVDSEQKLQIHLYFFWSKRCPHCHRALPLIPKLIESYPWLAVHRFELSENKRHVQLYFRMLHGLNRKANSVPGFLFCEQVIVGYGREETTGAELKQGLETCYQEQLTALKKKAEPTKPENQILEENKVTTPQKPN